MVASSALRPAHTVGSISGSVPSDTLVACMGVAFTFAAVLVLTPGDRARKLKLADLYFSVPFYPAVAALALHAVLTLGGSLADRWRGTSWSSHAMLQLYLAGMAGQTAVLWRGSSALSYKLMMTLHHVVSMFCFGYGLATGRMHFFGALDALCEVTTVFLNNVFLFKEHPAGAAADVANGLLLWLSFLVFRLALFPYWIYLWRTDIAADPERTWAASDAVERYFYPATTLLLLGLSALWFGKITTGLLHKVFPERVPASSPLGSPAGSPAAKKQL